MQIKGLIIHHPRTIEVCTYSIDLPPEGYVIVRVSTCALCTWEQRVYKGVKQTYPFWGGHEVCGTVECWSTELDGKFVQGQPVALALMQRCGICAVCRNNLDNHCGYLNLPVVANTPSGPRGLSDFLIVPAYQVIPLRAEQQLRYGPLIEPLACVLRSIGRSGVRLGSDAIVLGTGTLGQIHASVLRALGAAVLILDLEEDASAAVERVQFWSRGRGANSVFCTRGGPRWIEAAVNMAARGGSVVLFQSVRESAPTMLNANDVHYREISIIGSISQRLEDFDAAVNLLSCHPDFFESLNLQTISYTRARDAFEIALSGKVNRVLISFDDL